MKFKDNLLRFVRAVPLIDGLPDLEWEHFRLAVKELFFTTLLSTSPLWIGAFAASLISAGTSQSENIKILSLLWDNLKASINTGALIIYSAALIAPVIYIATQEAKGTLSTKVFPSRMWHILLATDNSISWMRLFYHSVSRTEYEPILRFSLLYILIPIHPTSSSNSLLLQESNI
ncbi:TPA: hypothetical protein ACLM4Z_005778 [Pseudomonas aeruginosa]